MLLGIFGVIAGLFLVALAGSGGNGRGPGGRSSR